MQPSETVIDALSKKARTVPELVEETGPRTFVTTLRALLQL